MGKKFFSFVVFLLIAGAAGAWVGSRYQRESAPMETELVLYGNVDIREIQLAFEENGRIADIRVDEGDAVKKGRRLAGLETIRFELAVDRAAARVTAQKDVVAKLEAGSREEEIRQARADVEAARIAAKDASRTYHRLEPLAVKDYTSRERADNARAKARLASARLKAAEQRLNLALAGPRKEDIAAARAELKALEAELAIRRQNLADAQLYAPSDGIIRNRILEPGDMASPQQPVFRLALSNPVWARVYISETDLGKISPGMKAHVTTDSFPENRYEGWIGYISPSAEFTPKTVETREVRTHLVYQVRVFVCNPQNELRLGMPATVIIPLKPSTFKINGAGPARCGSG
jgi:HlyD family secretion protein